MKKLIITCIMIFGAMPVSAIIPPDAAIIQVHDMQYIKDQKFRYQEYNDFKEVQEEKDRYNKKNEPAQPLIQKIFNKKSKFVEDNGEIKIQYEEEMAGSVFSIGILSVPGTFARTKTPIASSRFATESFNVNFLSGTLS